MESDAPEVDPFDRLRARWIIALASGCFAFAYAALYASGRLRDAPGPFDWYLFFCVASLATAAVLMGVAIRAGVDPGRLIGAPPSPREILVAASCSVPLLMLGPDEAAADRVELASERGEVHESRQGAA
jgi:hypothetical protein